MLIRSLSVYSYEMFPVIDISNTCRKTLQKIPKSMIKI
jgi:hypothetical protein